MKRKVDSGIVKEIQKVSDDLSLITLAPIADEGWVEKRVPIYAIDLFPRIIKGRPVDITLERKGLFKRRFLQTVETSNTCQSSEIPYSMVHEINQRYRKIFFQ